MSLSENFYRNSPASLQTLLLNCKAAELWLERYGPKFERRLTEFLSNQWLTTAGLKDYQNQKLQRLIRHAYDTVPYYKNIMDSRKLQPGDIRTTEDLWKMPLLTKSDIKSHFKELISRRYPKWLLRHGHTSGTTGTPLDVRYDIDTCVVHHAADWRQKIWAGMKPGDRYASLQGRVIVTIEQKNPPFWRKNYINNQLFLSSFHLTAENLPHYFNKLESDGIRFIEGYPSTMYILAMYLNRLGKPYPMKAVLTSSETLFDNQRAAIERAFECKVFDFYGMAERVIFATECDHHNGHHVNSDYGILEFLDGDGQPVEKGRLGRLVATGLHNMAMPLIRYETNDSCALKIEACSCGRAFPLMEDVTTKNESIVTLPDGRLISPSVLTHPFKPMHNILASQIIQEEIDVLRVKIVKSHEYSRKDEDILVNAFHERLGKDIRIQVEYVNEIPRTASGKFKWVVSNVNPKFYP